MLVGVQVSSLDNTMVNEFRNMTMAEFALWRRISRHIEDVHEIIVAAAKSLKDHLLLTMG